MNRHSQPRLYRASFSNGWARGVAITLACFLVAGTNVISGSAQAADPGSWSGDASMGTARRDHAMVLLTAPQCRNDPSPSWCGKVLAIGGDGASLPDAPYASVEMFDAEGGPTGAWRSCPADSASATCPGPMAEARRGTVRAVVLEDGRVLVAGGRASLTLCPTQDTCTGLGPDAEIYVPDTGAWVPTSSPRPGIAFDSLTRLDGPACTSGTRPVWCGRVLGLQGRDTYVYDPGTETWTKTANALAANHGGDGTATLLADGRVLVVRSPFLPEVYDPSAGLWSQTGPTIAARLQHTATVLGGPLCAADRTARPPWCGKVLFAGGASATAELFDPQANPGDSQWIATGAFEDQNVRYGSSATLLDDGTVLVAGGGTSFGSTSGTARAQRYDPTSGEWTTAPALGTPRTQQPALLLERGKVLVAGGWTTGASPTNTAELYSRTGSGGPTGPPPRVDSVTPGWAATADPGAPRDRTDAEVVIEGAGFLTVTGVTFASAAGDLRAALFHPDPDRPDKALVVTVPKRRDPGPVTVVVTSKMGGPSARNAPSAAFRYLAPSGGEWAMAGNFNVGRLLHTANVLADGTVVVAGGFEPSGRFLDYSTDRRPLASTEWYDPKGVVPGRPDQLGRWRQSGSMVVARLGHAAAPLADGRLLVVGGSTDLPTDYDLGFPNLVPIAHAEVWNPDAIDITSNNRGSWGPVAPMLLPRLGPTATLLNPPACAASPPPVGYPCGEVLVVGGDVAGTAERFDPAVGVWRPAGTLPSGSIRRHTATLLPSGRVMVTGGVDISTGLATRVTQIYDPVADRWTQVGLLSVPRALHTATLLADGRVLVVGGASRSIGLDLPADGDDALGSAEVYTPGGCPGQPGVAAWCPTDPLGVPRQLHTATALPNGDVLVVGGSKTYDALHRSAEIFDPRGNGGTGAFRPAPFSGPPRINHVAVLLPPGPISGCGPSCGTVLVTGGKADVYETASTQLFFAIPEIRAINPDRGFSHGGTTVRITGAGLAAVDAPEKVLFGDIKARSVTVVSDSEILAVSPRHAAGNVDVRVQGPGGVSETVSAGRFEYSIVNRIADLTAVALDEHTAQLHFTPPGDPPDTRYVIKQSTSPISDLASFDAASARCGGVCELSVKPEMSGDSVSFTVHDLTPNTTYQFAIRAIAPDGSVGQLSNSVSVTTAVCRTVSAATNQVAYGSGYSLVGLPDGAVVGSDSPLYGWFNRNSGTYSVQPPDQPVEAAHGYWTYNICPKLVALSPSGVPRPPGADSVRLALNAYHASMIGNPSATSAVTASGYDFAARWDPASGSYRISAYQQPQTLAVGEGMWAFSFADTTLNIRP